MNKLYAYGLGVALLAAAAPPARAQHRPAGPSYSLGSPQNLVRQLETEVAADLARRQPKPTVSLRVAASKDFTGLVNYREDLASTGEYLIGELAGVPNSSFFLRVEGNQVEGNIVLRDARRAYRYSTDARGEAQVQEVDIDQVICIDYDKPLGYQAPAPATAGRGTATAAAVVSLQSLPGAKGCIYLDLDGQYVAGTPWNNGNPIDAAPSGIQNDAAKVQAFWELVSEDFRPFDMNVTTDEAVFNAYPKNMRMRVIVTPTNTAAPGAGGVAYVTSFRYNNDTPCWVFMSDPKSGGEAASHEVGHTLGLSHDGRTSPSEGYYQGQGSWAPIMGVGYYKPVTQWSKGEYNSANNREDDLAIMSGATYNVGYRADDHGNSAGAATPLARSGNALTGSGLIERTDDQDYFSFTTSGGAVSFSVKTVARYGNLDVIVRLLDSNGTVVGTFDTSGSLNATVSTTLGAGTYFVQVDGTGAGNPATDGYSDYASLGTFTVAGTAPAGGTPPPQPPIVSADPNLAGLYTLQNRNSGLNLDISDASTADRARVQQLAGNGSTSQQFRLTHLGNGLYSIIAQHSGKCLDVGGASTADGAALVQWPYLNQANQQFYAFSTGGGFYKLVAKHSNKVVEVAGGSSASRALVQQFTDNGTPGQQWKLSPVSSTPPPAFSTLLEAELATVNGGMRAEACTEGGQNMGYIDQGDYLIWRGLNVPTTGRYQLEYRVASLSSGGNFAVDFNNGAIALPALTFPATGAWQNWTTVSQTVSLSAGTYDLRILARGAGWNLNWVRLTRLAEAAADTPPVVAGAAGAAELVLYPNPVTDQLNLRGAGLAGARLSVVNTVGQQVWEGTYQEGQPLDVSRLAAGTYLLRVAAPNQVVITRRFVK